MIEKPMIAEYLCNHQANSIRNSLLKDNDFISKYDLRPTAVITLGGKVHLNQNALFAAVRRLLNKKEAVPIPDVDGNKHTLSLEQGHIYFESSSKEIKARIDNFLILSPDREERIENLRKFIADIGPMSPDLSGMIIEAEKGELSYEQLDKLLHQVSNGVASLQNRLKNAFNTEQATLDKLIPSSLTYYDYFCGPNPGNTDPEEYLGSVLPNYRKELIQRNIVEGLDVCLQGALRDDLMPGAWMVDYSDDELWDSLEACDPFRDPFALLGALDIVLYRQKDERFGSFTEKALTTLVNDEFFRNDGIDVYELLPMLAFSHLAVNIDFRAVHHIALPQVVWQLSFKLATIRRLFYLQMDQVLLMQKSINRGVVQYDVGANPVDLFDKLGHAKRWCLEF